MLPLLSTLTHYRSSYRRMYSDQKKSDNLFSKITDKISNSGKEAMEGIGRKVPTISPIELASKSVKAINDTVEGTKGSLGAVSASMKETKDTLVTTIKLGRVVIVICAIFFTVDFVLKSSASICDSSEKIYTHYQKYQNSKKTE